MNRSFPKIQVSDAKEQHSEDEVNVYVKAAANEGPKADAGEDIAISLPKTWVILDGSGKCNSASPNSVTCPCRYASYFRAKMTTILFCNFTNFPLHVQ